jgi:DNA-binding MarR family transcriptional regulator
MMPSRKFPGSAFLLAQVGSHAAIKFKEQMAGLGVTPQTAGILRLLSMHEGTSQQDLSARLGIHPSRLVALVDELERQAWVERTQNASDRRQYALLLTDLGKQILVKIGHAARRHQDALCASLTAEERETLCGLLMKIADEQGLKPGVHPGWSR